MKATLGVLLTLKILYAFSQEIIYFENFDSGNAGWANDVGGTITDNWVLGDVTFQTGADGDYWGMPNISGQYENNVVAVVTSPTIDLSGYKDLNLSVSIRYDTENQWDGFNIEYSSNGGINWTILGAVGEGTNWYNDDDVDAIGDGIDGWSSDNSLWQTATISLPAGLLNSTQSRFRVRFQSDNSVTDIGVAFDNFQITGSVPSVDIMNEPTAVNTLDAFSVTFEWEVDVTGFESSDIVLSNASISNFSATDGNTYTADVTPNGQGDITIDIGANEVESGNNAAQTVTISYDITSPSVSFSGVPSVVGGETTSILIEFSEDVQYFATGDISLTNATKVTFDSINGSTYSQSFTPNGSGNVSISIASSVATDLAGNSNTASEVLSIPYSSSMAPGDVSTNLSLWLRASDGITLNGTNISAWADISGNSNDASQATPTLQPELLTDELNGNPMINFSENQLDGTAGFYTHEYFVVTQPSEIYSNNNVVGRILGFEENSFSTLSLGPTTNFTDNEVITHAVGQFSTDYRAVQVNTTSSFGNPIIINCRNNDIVSPTFQQIYRNGVDVVTNHVNIGAFENLSNQFYRIGSNSYTTEVPYNGGIAEVISYSTTLSDSDRRDVETYLAIRYGITLDISSENYTAGGTNIYSHTSYNADIAGIGRDLTNQGLNQTTSKSVNAGSIIEMYSASDLTDGEYLIWGNNDSSVSFVDDNIPSGVTQRMERVWRVDETGDVGTVTVKVDMTSITLDPDNSSLNLIIAPTSATIPTDLSSATVTSTGVISSENGRNYVTFSGVNFSDGDYFTIGGDIQSVIPGGSSGGSNLSVWLKADVGITSSGSLVGSWTDQSGQANDVTQGNDTNKPMYVSSGINGKPALYFSGDDNLETVNGFYTNEYFIVLKPDLQISTSNTIGYALGFESGDVGGLYFGNVGVVANDVIGQTIDNQSGTGSYDVAITSSTFTDSAFVINVRNNSAGTGQEFWVNGVNQSASSSGTFTNLSDQPLRVGNNFDGDNAFEGYVAEVISYSDTLESGWRRDVESYLGLKYGIPLDLSSPLRIDGRDLYAFSSYTYDVVGIGTDLDYGLDITSAISTSSDGIVRIESASDLDNGEYLVWGNDNGRKDTIQTTEMPSNVDERLQAEWRVSVVGSPGTVSVKFYTGGIIDFNERPQTAGLYELLIDSDGDFGTVSSSVSASSVSNDTLTFENVSLDSGDYFTLALASQPVVTGLALWLKADAEVEEGTNNNSENGDLARTWKDQSGNGNDFSQSTSAQRPTFYTDSLNGNPVVRFNDGYTYMGLASTNLDPRTMFIVYRDTSTASLTSPFNNEDGIGKGTFGRFTDI